MKGCILTLMFFLACWVGYGVVLASRLDPPLLAWGSAAGGALGAVILLGSLLGMGRSFSMSRVLDRAEHEFPLRDKPLYELVKAEPADVIRELIAAGADPSLPDAFGDAPLFNTDDADTIRALVEGGADPNLRNRHGETWLSIAARYGQVEVVQGLIELGADFEAEMTSMGRGWTALVSAFTSNHPEAAALLAAAGARDERLSAANGKEIDAASSPVAVVLQYLAAIHRGEIKDAAALRHDLGPEGLDDVVVDVWQKSRPRQPTLISGFGHDQAASVAVTGAGDYGVALTWWYQLQKVDTGGELPWKIAREWSVEGGGR